jgi:hypothetical protein
LTTAAEWIFTGFESGQEVNLGLRRREDDVFKKKNPARTWRALNSACDAPTLNLGYGSRMRFEESNASFIGSEEEEEEERRPASRRSYRSPGESGGRGRLNSGGEVLIDKRIVLRWGELLITRAESRRPRVALGPCAKSRASRLVPHVQA